MHTDSVRLLHALFLNRNHPHPTAEVVEATKVSSGSVISSIPKSKSSTLQKRVNNIEALLEYACPIIAEVEVRLVIKRQHTLQLFPKTLRQTFYFASAENFDGC
jgi:hypothetical protein